MMACLRTTLIVLALATAVSSSVACDDPSTPTRPTQVTEDPGTASDEADVAAARPTVDAWLELIDDGDYREAYEITSSYLQGVHTVDDLVQRLKAAREPLGAMLSRTFRNATRTDTAPGAPDAPYVLFQFQTAFTHKASAFERVWAESEGDVWLVSGYTIR